MLIKFFKMLQAIIWQIYIAEYDSYPRRQIVLSWNFYKRHKWKFVGECWQFPWELPGIGNGFPSKILVKVKTSARSAEPVW